MPIKGLPVLIEAAKWFEILTALWLVDFTLSLIHGCAEKSVSLAGLMDFRQGKTCTSTHDLVKEQKTKGYFTIEKQERYNFYKRIKQHYV